MCRSSECYPTFASGMGCIFLLCGRDQNIASCNNIVIWPGKIPLIFLLYCLYLYIGCYFGDPANSEMRVWVEGVSPSRLEAAETCSDAYALAGALLHLLFTPQELASSNATKARTDGIILLNDRKLNAIRG